MSLLTVRRMRAWVLFLTTVNLGLVIAVYIYIVNLFSESSNGWRPTSTAGFYLKPLHYLELFSTGFLFFAYLYSLWCNIYTPPRIIRAFIMSALAITLLVVEILFLIKQAHDTDSLDKSGAITKFGLFSCPKGFPGEVGCLLTNSNQFFAIITTLFVLAEVVVTLVLKEKKKEEVVYVYDPRDDDDSDGGSVIIMV